MATNSQAQCNVQGDANGDCTVDGIDYVIWFNNFSSTTTGGPSDGDFNGNGSVDGIDYVIWFNNFGFGGGSTPTPTNKPNATPTSTPRPTSTPTPPFQTNCVRAYTNDSPWNTKVEDTGLSYHPDSSSFIQTLSNAQSASFLGSNPDSYTYPVYEVNNSTPMKTVNFTGVYSNVTNGGQTLNRQSGGGSVQVPIPDGAVQSQGNDAQIIIINKDTGDEWAFISSRQVSSTTWSAKNGYHYNINWSGVAPSGFGSRGAGVTYLSGLIRRCEVDQGHIDHALAFAYDYPCGRSTCNANGYDYYVWPATKSDGKGTENGDIPEGARLHISPSASSSEIQQWCGSDNTCRIMVRALEDYGMFVIDNSGHAKIYPEDNVTANWGSILVNNTPRNIPLSRFKVLSF